MVLQQSILSSPSVIVKRDNQQHKINQRSSLERENGKGIVSSKRLSFISKPQEHYISDKQRKGNMLLGEQIRMDREQNIFHLLKQKEQLMLEETSTSKIEKFVRS